MEWNPATGQKMTLKGTNLIVPNNPIIPFIEADGTGRDIVGATKVKTSEFAKAIVENI